jgi:hypothetical protein
MFTSLPLQIFAHLDRHKLRLLAGVGDVHHIDANPSRLAEAVRERHGCRDPMQGRAGKIQALCGTLK